MNNGNQIRVALLGAGYIVDLHVEALARINNLSIVAVCDLSLERAQQVALRIGAKAYDDLEVMLTTERLDVVHNLSPPEVHFATTKQILQSGVDAYVEKPFVTKVADSRELADLAESLGRRLGVSHNFLWSENYRRLKSDIDEGRLGRIDHVNIVWQKELPQIEAGAVDAWMFQDSVNILGEIGPHPLGHLLDLLGDPDGIDVVATNPITLGNGVDFYRRWQMHGQAGNSAFNILLSFAPGYTQHYVHARGSLSAATVDFERNTYIRHHHRPGQFDLERLRSTSAESLQTMAEGARTLTRIVATKTKLSKFGSPFSNSVGEAVEAFYKARDNAADAHGLDAEFATNVVGLIERVASAAALPASTRLSDQPRTKRETSGPADTLVIGGTGFIGRNLVERLTAAGHVVRVVGRSATKLRGFDDDPVETVIGDLGDDAFVDKALDGIKFVYSLAKGSGDTFEDWQRTEVEPMRRLAEACLSHKVERLVYTSSIAVFYAGDNTRIDNSTAPDPGILESNVYAKTKAACEEVLLKMFRDRSLPVVITRPGIVVGSGGPPKHGGLAQWPAASVCVIPGRGDYPLPFVLATDVADALVSCARADDANGRCLNLVGDVQLTANEYVDELERIAGVKFDRHNSPIWLLYAGEFGKWLVKMAVRHHNRRFPRYREQASLKFASPFDNRETKALLDWVPESKRDAFIEQGIAVPVRETMAD